MEAPHFQFTELRRRIHSKEVDGLLFKDGSVYTGDTMNSKTKTKSEDEGEDTEAGENKLTEGKIGCNTEVTLLVPAQQAQQEQQEQQEPAFPAFGDVDPLGDRNIPHGQGRMIYKNFREYQGAFVNGKKEGKGKMTWPVHDFAYGLPLPPNTNIDREGEGERTLTPLTRWSFVNGINGITGMGEAGHRVRRTHVLTSDAVALLLWGKHPGDFVTISEIKKIDDVVWLKLHESSEEQLKKSSNYSEFDIKVEGWVRSNDPEKGEIYLEQFCRTSHQESYEGDWCDDKRHGIGIHQLSDGTVREGIFVNSCFMEKKEEEAKDEDKDKER